MLTFEQRFERCDGRSIAKLREGFDGGAPDFRRIVFERRDEMRGGGLFARETERACSRCAFGGRFGCPQIIGRFVQIVVFDESCARSLSPFDAARGERAQQLGGNGLTSSPVG